MHFLSVSLAVFGFGAALLVPATSATADTPDTVDQRCGIVGADGEPAYPFPSELVDGLLVDPAARQVRVATFDVNLRGQQPGALAADLAGGGNLNAERVAKSIQQADADIVLLTGFDADETAARTLNDEYLLHPQDDERAVDYPYVYAGPSNKGAPSGADLDKDKVVGGPGDAWGYGDFPGQGSMVLLSKHPIDEDRVQTVTKQRWSQVPGNSISEAGLSGAIAQAMPVMESGLWDVPVEVAGSTVRIIAVQADHGEDPVSYAVPRHRDQLRVVGDWVSGAAYLQDDEDWPAVATEPYVVLGELGEGALENPESSILREQLGSNGQRENNDVNYILPAEALKIARQGAIRDQQLSAPVPSQDPSSVARTPELLWSDLKF